jgi:hypothetical protein
MTTTERRAAHNSTYKKLAVQWLNETLCLVSSSVLADSFVLRNRQLLVAAKRYKPFKKHSMNHKQYLYFTLSILFYSSCTPSFDYNKPDTENNQFHYEHLLTIKMTPDVKNLYSYGDELGIDASYYLAFECNLETANSIIRANKLIKDEERGNPLYSGFKQKWWNQNEIDTLTRYVYSNDERTYFKYFWYNESSHRAYFLDFDL